MESDQHNYECMIWFANAKEPQSTNCCNKTFWKACIKRVPTPECPNCRMLNFSYSLNSELEKIIQTLPVACEFCSKDIKQEELADHTRVCEERKITCKFCHTSIAIKDLTSHVQSEHFEVLLHTFDDSVEDEENAKNFTAKEHHIKPTVKNYMRRNAYLGSTGKYYWGGKLDKKCKCCKGVWGPFSGWNCKACMDLDVKARNLGPQYKVNNRGIIACFNLDDGKFYCNWREQVENREFKKEILIWSKDSSRQCASCQCL